MFRQRSGERFQVWPGIRPFVRTFVLGVLPVPDLIDRCRVRRKAGSLIAGRRWPGMAATGRDAAELAVLRLLWLQRQTRRAVRSRQAEAARMVARDGLSFRALTAGLAVGLRSGWSRRTRLLLRAGTEKAAPDGAVLPINRPAVRRQHSLAASHYPLTLSRLPTCWPGGGRSRISALISVASLRRLGA
jgi:hypothetical protein